MSDVETNLDLIQWLGDDMSLKVFSYLDNPRDLVRASAVSSSWNDFGKLFVFLLLAVLGFYHVYLYLFKCLFI